MKRLKPANFYADAVITQKISRQDPKVLFTDIDNTFFHPKTRVAMKKLVKLLIQKSYALVAITGNDFKGVKKRIDSGELPAFDVIAGAVGTEIYVLKTSGRYQKDLKFEKILANKKFNVADLRRRANRLIAAAQKTNPDWGLDWQKGKRQKFKLSFYFYGLTSEVSEIKKIFERTFHQQLTIICEEKNYNTKKHRRGLPQKYCLDILPISKSGSIRYLAQTLNIQDCLAAGDSGNDRQMLADGVCYPVIVGGADQDLKNFINQLIKTHRLKNFFVESHANHRAAQSLIEAINQL